MRAILLLVLFFFWVSCSNCDDPDTLDEESSSSIESSESYSSSESSSSEESRSSSSDSEISEKMSENAHPDFIKIIVRPYTRRSCQMTHMSQQFFIRANNNTATAAGNGLIAVKT